MIVRYMHKVLRRAPVNDVATGHPPGRSPKIDSHGLILTGSGTFGGATGYVRVVFIKKHSFCMEGIEFC